MTCHTAAVEPLRWPNAWAPHGVEPTATDALRKQICSAARPSQLSLRASPPNQLDGTYKHTHTHTHTRSASAGNRTRVTSMATMYSTTRPLMLLSSCSLSGCPSGCTGSWRCILGTAWAFCLMIYMQMLPHGLEPWTSRLLAERSSQLSYESWWHGHDSQDRKCGAGELQVRHATGAWTS